VSDSGRLTLAFSPLLVIYLLSDFLEPTQRNVTQQYELEEVMGIRSISPAAASFVSPGFGAAAAGLTYFAPSGPRVAALAGSIGFGTVAATYAVYSVLGIQYGSRGYLFL
jgi:hypothetical protein